MEDYLLLLAVGLDLLVGDPDFYPHPVVIIGRLISLLEDNLRKVTNTNSQERWAGVGLVLIIVVFTYVSTTLLVALVYQINFYLGTVVNVWLLSASLAVTGLASAAKEVYEALVEGNLELARRRLNLIVGRDTDQLQSQAVIRGTIETVAENTNDGVIAPLVYALLGGAPLALTYKAINTLDSMLGYTNETYRYFGWAAARLDDIANWIPARLTGGLLVLAAFICRKDWQQAVKIIFRDAEKHPSPNAGISEAAVAGALNIRLGGVNYYQGQESFRAYLGDLEVEFKPEQIIEAVNLMYWGTGILVLVGLIIH
jgi:adenosylcobinamide-phosphate synthase